MKLLNAVQKLVLPFIRSADEDATTKHTGHGLAVPGDGPRTVLVEYHTPEKLAKLLNFQLPNGQGKGKDGLLAIIEDVLRFSVNTWDQGFLDKLYSSTNAVCVQDMILIHSHVLILYSGWSSIGTSLGCFKHQCKDFLRPILW